MLLDFYVNDRINLAYTNKNNQTPWTCLHNKVTCNWRRCFLKFFLVPFFFKNNEVFLGGEKWNTHSTKISCDNSQALCGK